MARQDEMNLAVYSAPRVYRYYLSDRLTPAEAACFSKYKPYISGRDVLDVGVGAGRTTRYLAPLARRYEAIDFSPVMVAYIKRAMSQISVRQADFRDLGMFETDSFDFILATDNVIDALSHEGRLAALREAARVLRPGGILVFSSHNIRYTKAFSGPRMNWSRNPVRLAAGVVRFAQSWWNHARVRSMRLLESDYALLNDPGHFFACLHYYSAHPIVTTQLKRAGMSLLEAYDTGGRVLAEHDDDSQTPSLTYVAQTDASGLPVAAPDQSWSTPA